MRSIVTTLIAVISLMTASLGQSIHSGTDTTSRNFSAGWYRLGGANGDYYIIPKTGNAIRFSLPKTGSIGQVLRRTGTLPNAYSWQTLNYGDLANTPGSLPPSGPAGGSLTGTYPNPTLSTNAILDASRRPEGFEYFHDILAFGRHAGFPTLERRISGTWTANGLSTDDKFAFSQKESGATDAVPASNTTYDGARYTWTSGALGYSGVENIQVSTGYIGTPHSYSVVVETGTNGTAWTLRGSVATTGSAETLNIPITNWGADTWLRVTFLVTGNGSTNQLRLVSLRALATRKGDQGGGKELQVPYEWDANRSVTVQGLYSPGAIQSATNVIAPTVSVSVISATSGAQIAVNNSLKLNQGIEFADGSKMTTAPTSSTGSGSGITPFYDIVTPTSAAQLNTAITNCTKPVLYVMGTSLNISEALIINNKTNLRIIGNNLELVLTSWNDGMQGIIFDLRGTLTRVSIEGFRLNCPLPSTAGDGGGYALMIARGAVVTAINGLTVRDCEFTSPNIHQNAISLVCVGWGGHHQHSKCTGSPLPCQRCKADVF